MEELFKMFVIGTEEAEIISVNPPKPHNHEFEELLVGVKGQVEHFLDYKTTQLKAPFVSFVTQGKTHRLVPKVLDNECQIFVIRFKRELIPETTFKLYSLYHQKGQMELVNNVGFNKMKTILDLLYSESKEVKTNISLIRQLLGVLFTLIEKEREIPSPLSKKTKDSYINVFLKILEEKYREPNGVQYYADRLSMTPRNLNLICKSELSKSVSEIIETRKLTEAKNLLINTSKTIGEIAFEIGYNDNSYFSKVFKKKSKISPAEFREEMQASLVS